MPASAVDASMTLAPVIRYRDVGAAARWLREAFGFEIVSLVDGEASPDGTAIYAEVSHGNGTVMLVPVGQSDLDAHMRHPDELGGIETQTCYVTIDNAEAHLARAVKAGAEIVLPVGGGDTGQLGYTCRDLEGHLWSFGTYAPARGTAARDMAKAAIALAAQKTAGSRGRVVYPVMTAGLMGLAGLAWFNPDNPLSSRATSLFQRMAGPSATADTDPAVAESARKAEASVRDQVHQSEETILKLRQEIAETRRAVKAAQDAANAATRDLALEYSKRTAAEQGTTGTAQKVQALEAELAINKEKLATLQSELMKERSARGQSVQALEQEVKKREQLEHVVDELDRKADDQLQAQSQSDAATATTKAATAAAPVSVPATTGSVNRKPEATPPARTVKPEPKKAVAPQAADRPRAPAPSRPKTASAKPKTGGDKPWPFSDWE
jgi:uncharacterized glyoxalase superfamily protein PhnB